MPLNPNGKIDKPALPFPDTAQAASVVRGRAESSASANQGTPTEEVMRGIWSAILPNAPGPLPLDESFFDLGGHSIIATRLIFEIRKVFVINAPLGLVFEQPTIKGLSGEVDALRNADLGLAYKDNDSSQLSTSAGARDVKKSAAAIEYGQDYVKLATNLQDSYPPLPSDFAAQPLTIFLTGATGFLGAFVLRDLLSRHSQVKKVICLVRASDSKKGTSRLREGSRDRGAWDEAWIESQRLEVVIGDLSLEHFGLGQEHWVRIAKEADVVLHNGALVRKFSSRLQLIISSYCRSTGFILTTDSDRPMSSQH